MSSWVLTQGGPAAPNINWKAPETRQRALELARELRSTHGKDWRSIRPGTNSEQARAMQFILNTLEGNGNLKLDGQFGGRRSQHSPDALARAQRAFGVVADRDGQRDTLDGAIARLRAPDGSLVPGDSTPKPMSPREVRSARQSREVVAARERNRAAAAGDGPAVPLSGVSGAQRPTEQLPPQTRLPDAHPGEVRPVGRERPALKPDDVERRLATAEALPNTRSQARAAAFKSLADDIRNAPEADRAKLRERLVAHLGANDPGLSSQRIASYLTANRGSDQTDIITGLRNALGPQSAAWERLQTLAANNAYSGLSPQMLDTLAGDRPVPVGDRNVDETRLATWGNLHMRAINHRVANREPLAPADRDFLLRERPSIAADILKRGIVAPDSDH